MSSHLKTIGGALLLAVGLPCAQATGQLKRAAPFEVVVSEVRLRPVIAQLDRAAAALFAEAGERYISPRVVPFEGSIRSSCGIVESDNAYACRMDGSIYYDKAFVAALRAGAEAALHTDGDMAAIDPIAHEWGHILQYLMGVDYSTARNRSEPDADCLSGVIIARLQRERAAKSEDLPEVRWALQIAGDEPLGEGVWGHVVEQLNLNAPPGTVPVITNARGNHGNSRERLQAFSRGFAGTIAGCTAGIPRPGRLVVSSVRWYVNDLATAYDRGAAENKPIVMVTGNFNDPAFQRFKRETLESPIMNQLANYAIFAYSDPSRDIVARNIGKALRYDHALQISLLAPNPNMLDEAARIDGAAPALEAVLFLTTKMKLHGWMGTTRAPWLPPLPGR